MLETLTGRLKWERTDNGMRVVIPARLSWGAIRRLLIDLCAYFVGFLSIFVTVACFCFIGGLSFHTFLHSNGMQSLYRTSLGCSAGLILARMLPRLFGKTVVTLSSAQITIEWNFRIRRPKEVFPTTTMHGFRFVERSGQIPLKNKIGQNEVQFVQAQSTHSFGEGVTREEADALITKMVEVFPFPS